MWGTNRGLLQLADSEFQPGPFGLSPDWVHQHFYGSLPKYAGTPDKFLAVIDCLLWRLLCFVVLSGISPAHAQPSFYPMGKLWFTDS
jgi:hypothetical protein